MRVMIVPASGPARVLTWSGDEQSLLADLENPEFTSPGDRVYNAATGLCLFARDGGQVSEETPPPVDVEPPPARPPSPSPDPCAPVDRLASVLAQSAERELARQQQFAEVIAAMQAQLAGEAITVASARGEARRAEEEARATRARIERFEALQTIEQESVERGWNSREVAHLVLKATVAIGQRALLRTIEEG